MTHFAPELHIPNGTTDISFYKHLGATEHFILRNDDGTIHVAEFDLDGATFHLHETMSWFPALEPIKAKGVTRSFQPRDCSGSDGGESGNGPRVWLPTRDV
jgi:PhnB protein